MDNVKKNEIPLFEKTINRLDLIVQRNNELSSRAQTKSVRIANSFPEKEPGELLKRDESIIGTLNTLMDKLDLSQNVLELVVEDLENAIP